MSKEVFYVQCSDHQLLAAVSPEEFEEVWALHRKLFPEHFNVTGFYGGGPNLESYKERGFKEVEIAEFNPKP